jgi:hypothetical protein
MFETHFHLIIMLFIIKLQNKNNKLRNMKMKYENEKSKT